MSSVWRSFVAVAVVVMLISAGGLLGYGMGFSHYQPRAFALEQRVQDQQNGLADAKASLSQAQEKLEQATSQIRQIQDDAHRTAQDLGQTHAQLDTARAEADKLSADLGATMVRLDVRELQLGALLDREQQWEQLRGVVDLMRNDRQLLAELRKPAPQTREEAIRYWQNIKQLAAGSDPRLAPKVDQVISATRTFFDWQDAQYASDNERNNAFFLTGAFLLPNVAGDFVDSVFLVVVARMDAALQQAQSLG